MKLKTIYIITGIIVLIAGLVLWGRFADPNRARVKQWNELGVGCLSNGHQNLAQHIHVALRVMVDGAPEIVPPNVGVLSSCMAEMHTHEADGVIHVETLKPDTHFTLGQFLKVYGKDIERPGFGVAMSVSGTSTSEYSNLVLTDKQEILLEYSKMEKN